jgi:hypothetical protein
MCRIFAILCNAGIDGVESTNELKHSGPDQKPERFWKFLKRGD